MKRINYFTAAIIGPALLLASCSGSKEDEKAGQKQDEATLIKVENVRIQQVPQIAEYTATVEPYKKNQISSSMPNRIKKIYVEVGDNVRAGQKLVELDAANQAQQKLQLDNLEVEYKRMRELFAVGGASQQQVDQLRTQYEAAKTAYTNLVENTILVSPVNGVVTARNYDDGDMTGANPILTVMQIQPVKVLVNISESDFSKVHVGMPVNIKLDVFGEEEFKGKVSLIHPTIDAATRTFVAEINIPNANSRIRPGMFARVVLDFGIANHVVVPDRSIVKRTGSGDRYVYVFKDGKVSYNKVELGRRMDDTYEVISGVDDNAQVVVAGQSSLSDGASVRVEK